jgi:quercetin dioxygenase-like cupin family protein
MTTASTELTTLLEAELDALPRPAEVMTVLIEVPPGAPGTPPHRHSGPVFGYVLEGELLYELEGSPARVIAPGEAFWEPGGERIHYKAANNLSDRWTRFVAVMVGVPGEPMLTPVPPEELERR